MDMLPDRGGYHRIKRVDGNQQPTRICCVAQDIAYDPGRPYCVERGRLENWRAEWWRAEDGQSSRRSSAGGTTPDEWWEWLSERVNGGGTHWIFGYDIWPLFCALGGIERIDQGDLIVADQSERLYAKDGPKFHRRLTGLMIASCPPTILDMRVKGGGRLRWIDLANYGLSLRFIQFEQLHVRLQSIIAEVDAYGQMIDLLDLGTWQTTAASQAWYAFRRRHMHTEIVVQPFKQVAMLERASYYGGRNECYRIGELPGEITHLDVSSMYTYLASNLMVPVEHIGTSSDVTIDDLGELLDHHHGIADVVIDCKTPCVPLRRDGELIYPVGSFRTTLSDPELAFAFNAGIVRKVFTLSLYRREAIFGSWARMILAAKQHLVEHGLNCMIDVLKRIGNSLYGKFGQRSKNWITDHGAEADFPWESWWQERDGHSEPVQHRSIAGVVQWLDEEAEGPESCPAISACVCAAGRLQLLELMILADERNVFYCDTDSLFVSKTGLMNLAEQGYIGPPGPGKLRIVETSDDVYLAGQKQYRFGDRNVCAGVAPWKTVESTVGEPVAYAVPLEHQLPHRRAGKLERYHQLSQVKRRYKGGVVLKSGRVVPHKLSYAERKACHE